MDDWRHIHEFTVDITDRFAILGANMEENILKRISRNIVWALLLVVTTWLGIDVQAQPRSIPRLPVNWGGLSDADLSVETPEEYLDAGAVVIFNLGLAMLERHSLEVDRHVRIKLLDDSGVELFRTVTIKYDPLDDLKKLKARIVRSDNSTVDIPGSTFTKSMVGGCNQVVIPFVGAGAGDFIEYAYTISYHAPVNHRGPDKFLLYNQAIDFQFQMERGKWKTFQWEGFKRDHIARFPDWCFYSVVPTLRAELTVFMGTEMIYAFVPHHIPDSLATPPPDVGSDHQFTRFSWHLENIPSVADESCSEGCCLEGPSLSFRFVGWSNEKVIAQQGISGDEWKSMGAAFDLYMRQYVKDSKQLKRQVKSLKSKTSDPIELATAIIEFVHNDIKIADSGHNMRPVCDDSKKLFKRKSGTFFERNILLLQMLQEAELDVKPVLIATSDRPALLQTGRCNYMICCLTIDSDVYFLDTSEPSTFGVLPALSRVSGGLLIDGDSSRLKSVKSK